MSLEIPRLFVCPITLDVMTDPVRTNCIEEKPKDSLIKRILSIFFNNFFLKTSQVEQINGHYFEKLALAKLLRQNNLTCPLCGRKITKVTPDKKLSDMIAKKFTNLSDEHKKHFEEAKKEVLNSYKEMIDQVVVPPNICSNRENRLNTNNSVNHRAFHLHNSLYRAFHPPRETDREKYDKVTNHISTRNLVLAERDADLIIFSYFRNKSYNEIVDKYLDLCSDAEIRASFQKLEKAIDVCKKISDPQIKNDIYYKIVQKAILLNRHLALAKRAASLITDRNKKNKTFEKIANKYISNYLENKNESFIKNAIIIANSNILDFSIQQRVLFKSVNAYSNNLKLKKAFELTKSLSLVTLKDFNKKHIAKCYVDKNFNNKNFEKALIAANQIFDRSTKDSAYNIIATKATSKIAFIKSFKTISKVSTFPKRFFLYFKITILIFSYSFLKILLSPFKLSHFALNFLVAKFRALLTRIRS